VRTTTKREAIKAIERKPMINKYLVDGTK